MCVRCAECARTCTRVPAWIRARADACSNGGLQMPEHVSEQSKQAAARIAKTWRSCVGSAGAPGNINGCCLFLRSPKSAQSESSLSAALRVPFLKCPLSRPALSLHTLLSLSLYLSVSPVSLSLRPGTRGHPPPRTARSCSNTASRPRHSSAHCPARGSWRQGARRTWLRCV